MNVVAGFPWTSSSDRSGAPYLTATGCRLDGSQLQQAIQGWISATESGVDDMYKCGEGTGTWIFPYFNSNVRSFSNEFADTFTQISQRGANFAGKEAVDQVHGLGETGVGLIAGFNQVMHTDIAKKITRSLGDKFGVQVPTAPGHGGDVGRVPGAPGTYIQTPKFWQAGMTDAALQCTFTLSNTINDNWSANAEMIKEFTRINKPETKGSIGITFPSVWKVLVPGLRFIRWAYVSGFKVDLLGARRMVGRSIVPEAYKIDIAWTSLTIESANFVDQS